MNAEEYRAWIPQFLAGQLSELEEQAFTARLEIDAALRDEVEELRQLWQGLGRLPREQPSGALRARFYQAIHALDKPKVAPSVLRGLPWQRFGQWAAISLVFVLGVMAGRVSNGASGSSAELTQLRSEVRSMREMVALSLLDRRSASARLEGVSWGSRAEQSDSNVTTALLTALNHDPNVNVRLSSVDALEKFASDASIRVALVDSIGVQDSPLVQIALIDAQVQIGNRDAVPELTRLARDAQANPNVHKRALWAIQKLQL